MLYTVCKVDRYVLTITKIIIIIILIFSCLIGAKCILAVCLILRSDSAISDVHGAVPLNILALNVCGNFLCFCC